MLDASKLTREALEAAIDWMDDLGKAEIQAPHELLLTDASIDKDELSELALEVCVRMRDVMFSAMAANPKRTDEVALQGLAVAYQYGALSMLKALSDIGGQDG